MSKTKSEQTDSATIASILNLCEPRDGPPVVDRGADPTSYHGHGRTGEHHVGAVYGRADREDREDCEDAEGGVGPTDPLDAIMALCDGGYEDIGGLDGLASRLEQAMEKVTVIGAYDLDEFRPFGDDESRVSMVSERTRLSDSFSLYSTPQELIASALLEPIKPSGDTQDTCKDDECESGTDPSEEGYRCSACGGCDQCQGVAACGGCDTCGGCDSCGGLKADGGCDGCNKEGAAMLLERAEPGAAGLLEQRAEPGAAELLAV